MLRKDVIEAVAQNSFNIFAVETINQCIALLSGLDAGEQDERGGFPDGSVNQRVRARLNYFAEKMRLFQHVPNGTSTRYNHSRKAKLGQ
jgi:hypothetical protein